MKNIYRNTAVNPLSVSRFNEELKLYITRKKSEGEKETHATISEKLEIQPQFLSMLKNGSRRLTEDMAEKFGKLFGVYPRSLLGLSDERRYTKIAFQEETNLLFKREGFIGTCLEYFGYKYLKYDLDYLEGSDDVIGVKYTIQTPDDNTFIITDRDLNNVAEDILNHIRVELEHCAKIRR